MEKINYELLDFIASSPTAFHTVSSVATRLVEEGYTELYESSEWILKAGGSYFVRRGASSLVAFRIPDEDFDGYQIAAAHTDSPMFKLKPDFELEDKYLKLSADKYGSPILSSWLDRPLSVAGRVVVRENNKIVTRLVETDTPIAIIPSLAPHLKTDKDAPLSLKTDMLALVGEGGKMRVSDLLADMLGIDFDSVISHDLYLVNSQKGVIWGSDFSFVSSPRLDDLQCVFAALSGFLYSLDETNVPVLALFDKEEVGSESSNGAASAFLPETLERISSSLGKARAEHLRLLSNSFFISADNAHALHPNHPEQSDSVNNGLLNSGIAIKHNAMGRYVTDAEGEGIVKTLCKAFDIPCFDYTNRSDIVGGSTLGHILQTHLSITGVDIGLPQLAMHSSFETAGARDTEYACRLFEAFFNSHIYKVANTFVIE